MNAEAWLMELIRLKESLAEGHLSEKERYALQLRVVEILEAQTVKARHALPADVKEDDLIPDSLPREWMKVEKEGDVVVCTLPRLLPRKHAMHAKIRAFYHAMYAPTLARFFENETFSSRQVVLWYIHGYRQFSFREILDHDNIETKVMTDLLVKYLQTDDSPTLCETHVSSMALGADLTRILLVPAERFAELYEKKEELRKTWSEACDCLPREVHPDD